MVTLYMVDFERIGPHRIGQVTYTANSADELAEQVYHFAQKHLASSNFEVQVDLEGGRGWIEHGRFGKFAIENLGEFWEKEE